jgi:hypothetical protein
MHRLVLLLLLLCVDWYFDTSFGTSPLTRPMYSTETFCHSMVYKQDVQRKIDGPELIDAAAAAIGPSQCCPAPVRALQESASSIVSSTDLVYVFMSIQC